MLESNSFMRIAQPGDTLVLVCNWQSKKHSIHGSKSKISARTGSGTPTVGRGSSGDEDRGLQKAGWSPDQFCSSYVQICSLHTKPIYNH